VNGSDDVIAWIALGISIVSAGVALVSLILGFRESSRRDEEISHLRREGERREEELSIFRQQLAADEDARSREQQARISVGQEIRADGSGRGIEYTVPLQNTGEYVATEIGVELVDADGASAGSGRLDRALVVGERDVVRVITPPRDRFTGPYEVFVQWRDGRGFNRKASGIQVGPPAP
jgi:hypothetical protein